MSTYPDNPFWYRVFEPQPFNKQNGSRGPKWEKNDDLGGEMLAS